MFAAAGVGGQAIWSAEDRLRSTSSAIAGGFVRTAFSWLGLGLGRDEDYFSHVNSGLAARIFSFPLYLAVFRQ